MSQIESSKIKKKLLNDEYYSKNKDNISIQHKEYRKKNAGYISAKKSLYYIEKKKKSNFNKINEFN
jgi:hypothetical protein